MKTTLIPFLLLLIALMPSRAWAQDEDSSEKAAATAEAPADNQSAPQEDMQRISLNDDDPLQPASDETLESLQPTIKGHGLELAMSLVGVPGYSYGIWFTEHGYNMDGVANMGFALDYTIRFRFPMELRLGLSWTYIGTGDAYWLSEDNKNYPELADYIENTLSFIAIEAAVYHMVPITEQIAFYYGGGLWGGVVLGSVDAYAIDSTCSLNADNLSDCGHSPISSRIDTVPPVLGSLIVTLGFKFTVFEKMTIRTEGGFKGYFYGQVGVGVEF